LTSTRKERNMKKWYDNEAVEFIGGCVFLLAGAAVSAYKSLKRRLFGG